jgi:hypothetical protein
MPWRGFFQVYGYLKDNHLAMELPRMEYRAEQMKVDLWIPGTRLVGFLLVWLPFSCAPGSTTYGVLVGLAMVSADEGARAVTTK